MKIRHITTVYSSKKIYAIGPQLNRRMFVEMQRHPREAALGHYWVEKVGTRTQFEVTSPTIRTLILSLTEEEDKFLAKCGGEAYYPEHVISPLTLETEIDSIKATNNGYYEIIFNTMGKRKKCNQIVGMVPTIIKFNLERIGNCWGRDKIGTLSLKYCSRHTSHTTFNLRS